MEAKDRRPHACNYWRTNELPLTLNLFLSDLTTLDGT